MLGGLYSDANSGIIGHDPSVLGSATFTFTIPGVTSSSAISDVVFEFGTGPDGHLSGTMGPPPRSSARWRQHRFAPGFGNGGHWNRQKEAKSTSAVVDSWNVGRS